MPTREAGPRWTSADIAKVTGAMLRRITFTGPYRHAEAILQRLRVGETLAAAAEAVGVPLPSEMHCSSLRLVDDGTADRYVESPWTFLPRSGDFCAASHLRARSSPNPDAPALATTLLLADKSLVADVSTASGRRDLDRLLSALESETGLGFTSTEVERLGDLEVFLLPATHDDESARVRIVCEEKAPLVELDLPAGITAVVRCVQRSGGQILADEIKTLVTSEPLTRARFQATSDGPHLSTVQVWLGENPARLWFEQSLSFIRRVHTKMRLVTRTIDLNSPWLEQWAKSRLHVDAVNGLRRVERSRAEKDLVVGEQSAAFVTTHAGAKRWGQRVRAPKSRARFFQSGAAPTGERLEFAVWLRSVLDNDSDGIERVLLLDPFFDAWGIELFARAQNAGCAFDVVTCLQRAENETQDEVKERLVKACEQIAPVLSPVTFQLRAYRGARPFHDRMLLAFDTTGRIVRGFNLSNSLEGAAKRFPLLVTEIPDDVVDVVADYVAALFVDATHLEVVFNAARREHANVRKPKPTPVPPEDVHVLFERVIAAAPNDLSGHFSALATKLAHLHDEDVEDVNAALRQEQALHAALASWLVQGAPREPLPVGVADVPVSARGLAILTSYGQGFDEASRVCSELLGHGEERGLAPWGVKGALSLLLEAAPSRFLEAVDGVAAAARDDDVTNEQRAPLAAILNAATNELNVRLCFRPPPHTFVVLLGARNAFVRALAAAAVGNLLTPYDERLRVPVEEAIALIEHLAVSERVIAVAEWIGDLRVRANRAEHVEPEPLRAIRCALMSRLVEWWPQASSRSLLREVILRMEGPLPGGWAADTTNDFLAPLTSAGRVSDECARGVWLDLMVERLERADVRFSSLCDVALTQVAAQLEAKSGSPHEIEPLMAIAKRARRDATRPFARADFRRWSRACEQLLWLDSFARLVLSDASSGSPMAAAADALLARCSGTVREDFMKRNDPGGLLEFANAVRSRTPSLAEAE